MNQNVRTRQGWSIHRAQIATRANSAALARRLYRMYLADAVGTASAARIEFSEEFVNDVLSQSFCFSLHFACV